MPVTIETVVAEWTDQTARPPRYVARQCELADDQLARRPGEYPLLVATAAGLLSLTSELLPQLRVGHAGLIAEDRLPDLLGRAMDQIVLDLNWEHRLIERLVQQNEQCHRRSLTTLLRTETDPRLKWQEAAADEARSIREMLVHPAQLAAAVEIMVADGLIARAAGGGFCPVGAEALPAAGLHLAVLEAAIRAHLGEVRRWNLPAPTPAQRLAVAREHSQVLSADCVAANSMLASEVNRGLEQNLARLVQRSETREQQLLDLVLGNEPLPREPDGSLNLLALASSLAGAVAAPDNVAAAIRRLADEGVLVPFGDGGREWVDAELADELRPATAAPPGPPPASPPAPEWDGRQLRERLRLLRDLRDEELITAEDYQRRKQELLAEL